MKVKCVQNFWVNAEDDNKEYELWFTEGNVYEIEYGPCCWPMIKHPETNEWYDITIDKKDETSNEWYGDDDLLYLVDVEEC